MSERSFLSLPPAFKPTRPLSRAARVGTFALETWSRIVLGPAPRTRDEQARELAWIAENTCALHGIRMRVRGSLPRGPVVLVANHIGYFDPLLIASLVPCAPIAKRQVASWPLIGELARRMGVMWVDRADAASGARVLREVLSALSADVSVLVFPEGTTTSGDTVLPFKRGVFGAARIAGVPVVPVALRYASPHAAWVGDDAFLPHYARAMAQAYTRVSVQFLAPIVPNAEADAVALAETARARIERALATDTSFDIADDLRRASTSMLQDELAFRAA